MQLWMRIVINVFELWDQIRLFFLMILLFDWHLYCSLNLNIWSFSKLFLCHVWISLFDRFWLFRSFWLFWLFWPSFAWSLFSFWWSHNFILPNVLLLNFFLLFLLFNILHLNLDINPSIFQGVQKLRYLGIFFCHCFVLIFHVHIFDNNFVQLWDVWFQPIQSYLFVSFLRLFCFCDRFLVGFQLWCLSLFAPWWFFVFHVNVWVV